MKQKFLLKTMLLLCALVAGSGTMWAEVVSGTTYSTKPTPDGWTVYEHTNNNASYFSLTYSDSYIQTSTFSQVNGFSSIILKARTYGGPSAEQALITVSWYDATTNAETVIGTISPSSKNLSNYTISSPTNPTANTSGYIKIQCKDASSNKGSGVSEVTITLTPTVCDKPSFTVGTGTYNNDQSVTLSSKTSGATIRYTTNGSDPDENSTVYSSAITVDRTMTIKAKAYKEGLDASEIASAEYTMVCLNPSIDKATNTYNNAFNATISCNTTGATIRYTTDGNTPTESSSVYSSPISVSTSQTITAKAFKEGYTASSEVSRSYTLTTATPTFSVKAGTYNEAKSVELNCTTENAAIRYTTNGDEPTSSSTLYEGAISVNRSMTIKSKAFKADFNDSEEASAEYILKCATPNITKADGDFVTTKVITMSSATDDATIYYTTDGNAPSSSSTAYNPENKPVISATTTFKAIAVKDGWTNSEVKEQTFTKLDVIEGLSALAAVTSTSNVTKYVNLTDAQVTWVNSSNGFMEDANTGIYLYGASPTLNKVYNGIFKVTYQLYNNMPEIKSFTNVEGEISDGSAKNPTIMTPDELDEAFTANLGRQIKIENFTVPTNSKNLTDNISLYGTSPFVSVDYGKTYTLVGYPFATSNTSTFRVTAAYEKPKTPTFDHVAGAFYEEFTLHLACTTTEVTIHYTTDGTDPTASSTEYIDATGIVIPTETTTVKAIAVKAGMVSDVATATYTYYSVKQPAFGTATGTSVYYNDKVTVTCETANSDIYYTLTTDGSEPAAPTSASTAYPEGGIAIAANTVKIKVIAKNGDNYSPVAEATYTLNNPEAPTANPAAGAVEIGTTVVLNSREGTTIYYTTDGTTTPDNTSTTYTGAITIDAAKTIKAIAIDGAGNSSSVLTAAYTIAKVATPQFSVAGGKVTQNSTVALTCTTEGATIYYTTDGTTPSASSTEYTATITISTDVTIKAVAIKANYDDSDVATAEYEVILPIAGYNIDFEADDLAQYVDWEFTNIALRTNKNITPHNNSNNYGINGSSSTATQGTSTASIATKAKVAHPGALKFYVSKESNNTTACSWKVEVSGNGTAWTQVGDAQSASSMDKGAWVEVSRNLSSYSNVYVKISYGSNTAIRAIDDITLTETAVDVTIPESKYLSFCYDSKLDFSDTDVKAYKASADNTGKVTLTKLDVVPAGEGVVLFASEAKPYTIPVAAENATVSNVTGNQMVGVLERTQVLWNPSENVYNYILQQGEFNKATTGYLKANRAYLSTSYDVSAAGARPLKIVFSDESTGIDTIDHSPLTIDRYYNLKGQRVDNPKKGGLYIMNGKKVVIK